MSLTQTAVAALLTAAGVMYFSTHWPLSRASGRGRPLVGAHRRRFRPARPPESDVVILAGGPARLE